MAIAYDNSTLIDNGTGSTNTKSHTTGSGENRIMFVGTYATGSSDLVTGVTYNGVSMTKIASASQAPNAMVSLWYLVNPASGANNVVISQSGSTNIGGVVATYTGASQTGVPDSYNTGTTSGVENITVSTTTVADNCWLCGFSWTNRNNSAGTDTTIRAGSTSQATYCDSNGAKTPAGSYSLSLVFTSSSAAMVVASFAPPQVSTFTPKCIMF